MVRQDRNGRTVVTQRSVTRQPQWRNWRKGERFDRRYARNYRQIDYRQYRGLRAPPRGYRYVRSGNDAVLVSVASGVIAAVLANAIRLSRSLAFRAESALWAPTSSGRGAQVPPPSLFRGRQPEGRPHGAASAIGQQ